MVRTLSDLERRSGRGTSRRQREQRAYYLVLASGGLAVAAVVVLVLWIAGVASFGLFLLLAVLAALAGFLLRRTLPR
jgi:type IV secretory pathway TrbD component